MATKKGATQTGVLNGKQIRFIDEYLIDLNASQAAIRAGYSKKTAGSQAFDLLKKPEIQSAIQAQQKLLANKAGITRERIIAEVAKIAFSDIRKVIDINTGIKPLQELDDETAGSIASVEIEALYAGKGEDRIQIGTTQKIKFWDKNSALEKLLKHLGMDEPKPPESDSADQLKEGFADMRAAFEKRLAKPAE